MCQSSCFRFSLLLIALTVGGAGCRSHGAHATASPSSSLARQERPTEPLATTPAVPPTPPEAAPATTAVAPPAAGPVSLVSFQPTEKSTPSPAEGEHRLPVPATAAPDDNTVSLPIDFPTALGLTQGQNPRIAFAQAQVAEAYAQHQAANALWLPHLRAGMNYNKHEGRIQDVAGQNIEVSRGASFGGLGSSAVGAGSPAVPGIYLSVQTADLVFQRRITSYGVNARRSQSAAMLNDQLLETSQAYLALLEAAQRRAIAHESLHRAEELANLTSEFARTGAGNQADADRAQAALALFRNELLRAEEAVGVSSARVMQQLSGDPLIRLEPQESQVVPIELVENVDAELSTFVAMGLANRPELAANRALVCAAVNRLEREKYAPWLPSLLLGTSYGAFAAGTGGQITNGSDRFDFDSAAWWELRNLGAGERAARDNAAAQIRQARMREIESMDLVAREIVEALSQIKARKQQLAIAQEGIEAALRSYERNRARIQNIQGLPIEMLQAIQALDQAQREYLRTVVDYNTAQFRLHRALGCPIQDIPHRPA